VSAGAFLRLFLALLQVALAAAAPLADARLHRPAPAAATAEADRRPASAAGAAECALCQFIRTPVAAAGGADPARAEPARSAGPLRPSTARLAAHEPGSPPARGPPRSSPRPILARGS
jgi:hypothetical protein